MSKLAGFREQSFMDQIALLAEVERDADPALVPDLLDLFVTPVGDAAVDTMVRNSLRSLMLGHDDALLQSLQSEHTPLAVFCAGIAGERALEKAVPVLLQRAQDWENDAETLHEALLALGRIGDPAALDLFRRYMRHPDDFIASLCIEHLGLLQDKEVQPELEALVTANEAPERYEQCDVATWKAIEALAAIASADALAFLASKLHHENPTARRIVHRCLVEAGEQATPHVVHVLRTTDTSDDRIMAANVLGFSGVRPAADALINALDDGLLQEPNERFAAYEALGRVPGMKGLVFLEDVLWQERDPLLLLAVVKSLDSLGQDGMAQGLARKIAVRASEDPEAVRPLLEAVVSSGARTLFGALSAVETMRATLLETAKAVADTQQLQELAEVLEEQGQTSAAQELRGLAQEDRTEGDALRLLAVDDSGAMRNFYTQVGVELGYKVATAGHGQEALDIIEQGYVFDVLVVDMNMPVMDGIELTAKLRSMPEWEAVPILMASTESAKSQAQLAKKAGISSFIVKPFSKDVLKNKISKLL